MGGNEEARLRALAGKLSPAKRKDIAEVIQADLDRRERERAQMAATQAAQAAPGVNKSSISGSLTREQVKELYGDVNDAVKQIRLRKLEEQIKDVRKLKPGRMRSWRFAVPGPRAVMVSAVIGVGTLKVLFSIGVVDAATVKELRDGAHVATPAVPAAKDMAPQAAVKPVEDAVERLRPVAGYASLRESDVKVLTQLDARRVELEKRKEALDAREVEIENQGRALAERLAELRSLTDRLSQARVEKDQKYEARLEQLSTVYGSMAPHEAAPLIARLENSIALPLMQRMPGKKMGQILSVMEQERAVELTKLLSSD